MKTFSRLSLFALVFLGIAFMFVGNTAEAQDPSLEVAGISDYEVGDPVTVTFRAAEAGGVYKEVPLDIDAGGDVTVTSHTVPGTHMTNSLGFLQVKGTITGTSPGTYISARWNSSDLFAKADLTGQVEEIKTVIAVHGPVPKVGLKVGDTFTQKIGIEGVDVAEDTDLSAWQMDIVFNPKILKAISVTEGDFLEQGEYDALFISDITTGRISASQARIGRMPSATPPLAASPAGVTGDGTLLTVEFMVLEFAEEPLGLHNIQLSNSNEERLSYCIEIRDLFVTTNQFPPEDVNRDGMVNVLDLMVVAGSIGMVPSNPRADLNNDGFVNVLDLVAVYQHSSWGGPVTATNVRDANAPVANGSLEPATIQTWIDLARVEDDGSAIFNLGITNLEALLASRIPSQTKLLLNYPNPFNPETWIPYQLVEATEVTMTIHSMNGSLIRTLELGHQAAGTYKNKSQAAYWDGRNEFGEQVASGLYFYTLTAGNFSATGKMLVRK